MSFAKAMRRFCGDCLGPLSWCDAIDLPSQLPHVRGIGQEAERNRMFRAIAYCGAAAEAWWCPRCGNWGVFSDDQRNVS